MNHIASRRAARGFTLIELLAAVGIAGVLSSLAWPSFEGSLQKGRRTDAMLAMAQLQIAQERWYANHRRYGTLAELRLGERSGAGHYRLDVSAADEQGYVALAQASGAQARDAACRHLRLSVVGGLTRRESGADEGVANDEAANRRCWGL
ncbi:type IV pilin protein [Piscinibacter sp.]|uniref:type IV pilin protein n=1 Tax=Piscinibacter sp. TaxID=1903157 RepID=UPI0039E3A75B